MGFEGECVPDRMQLPFCYLKFRMSIKFSKKLKYALLLRKNLFFNHFLSILTYIFGKYIIKTGLLRFGKDLVLREARWKC